MEFKLKHNDSACMHSLLLFPFEDVSLMGNFKYTSRPGNFDSPVRKRMAGISKTQKNKSRILVKHGTTSIISKTKSFPPPQVFPRTYTYDNFTGIRNATSYNQLTPGWVVTPRSRRVITGTTSVGRYWPSVFSGRSGYRVGPSLSA